MKTKTLTLLVITCILLVSGTSVAQKYFLGIKGGCTFSKFTNVKDAEADYLYRPGAGAGISFEYVLSKHFSLLTETNFAQKGMKIKSTLSDIPVEGNTILNTLQQPVLLKFNLPLKNWNFFIESGFYGAYNVSGTMKAKIGDEEMSQKINFKESQVQRWDAGIPVGLGTSVKAGPGRISLDLRYNIGLVDVSNPDPKPEGYKASFNRSAEITIGYAFRLGK